MVGYQQLPPTALRTQADARHGGAAKGQLSGRAQQPPAQPGFPSWCSQKEKAVPVLARSMASLELLCSNAVFQPSPRRAVSKAKCKPNLLPGCFPKTSNGKNYYSLQSSQHHSIHSTPIRKTLHTFHPWLPAAPLPLTRNTTNIPVQSITFSYSTDREPEHDSHRHTGTGKSCNH